MTEPTRTHRDEAVRGQYDDVILLNELPDDWPLGPVVVSTVPPDGVAVATDGRMVLLPGVPLPKGLEWRWHEDDPWHDGAERPPVGRPVEVRPVPAPEPATVRVPWEVALRDKKTDRRWTDEDGVTRTSRIRKAEVGDEDGDIYLIPEVTPDDGGRPYRGVIYKPDDEGMVEVLATPTDPPSEPWYRELFDGQRRRMEARDARETQPAPSVVPADSPDTGRWEPRHAGVSWVSAEDDRWEARLTPWALAKSWGGSTRAEVEAEDAITALRVALVRRDRPQPTAEQVKAWLVANADHGDPNAVPWKDLVIEDLVAILTAVDACTAEAAS